MQLNDLEKALGSSDKELDAYLSDVPAKQFREDINKLLSKYYMSKLEQGALMIAQGYRSQTFYNDHTDRCIAELSVMQAKYVIEEANK
jgi:hypothetical protein